MGKYWFDFNIRLAVQLMHAEKSFLIYIENVFSCNLLAMSLLPYSITITLIQIRFFLDSFAKHIIVKQTGSSHFPTFKIFFAKNILKGCSLIRIPKKWEVSKKKSCAHLSKYSSKILCSRSTFLNQSSVESQGFFRGC